MNTLIPMNAAGNILCDLDGVVYLGETEIQGSGQALTNLTAAGYQIQFVTNNATRTPDEAAQKIARVTGYSPDPGQVITSAMAGAALVGPDRIPTLMVGAAGARLELERYGCPIVENASDAEAVLVGLDTSLDYGVLTEATRALVAGARFVATNSDPTFPLPEGPAPGAGALVALLQTTSGREPEVAGKPHPPIRHLITQKLAPGPVFVVGDRDTTDLAMGRAEGWTTVLVQSGIDRNADADMTFPTLFDFSRELVG
jgi:HAD superfamily hydrolase (TIGR01450 family)